MTPTAAPKSVLCPPGGGGTPLGKARAVKHLNTPASGRQPG